MRALSYALICALAAGCSAAGEGQSAPRASGSGGSSAGAGAGTGTSGGSGGASAGGSSGGLGGSGATVGVGGSTGPGSGGASFDGCAEFSAQAENTFTRGADIIIAIDQSSSMTDETQWVQQQLNTFAQMVANSGVDLRVVIIVEKPGGPDFENPICVPPPLALPNCESNPPTFLHINQHVDSNDAFDMILMTYPQYAWVLRPGLPKHVVVITDDIPGNVSAAQFDTQFQGRDPQLLGHYTFHAVVPFTYCFPFADAQPDGQYTGLVQQRGGVAGDLCLQNFQTVWDALLQNVSTGAQAVLDCEWSIPPPPQGQTLDPNLVNLTYTGGGQQVVLGHVGSAAECANFANAWYYDTPQNPSKVMVCPDVCGEIRAGHAKQIDIVFGCQVVQAVPH